MSNTYLYKTFFPAAAISASRITPTCSFAWERTAERENEKAFLPFLYLVGSEHDALSINLDYETFLNLFLFLLRSSCDARLCQLPNECNVFGLLCAQPSLASHPKARRDEENDEEYQKDGQEEEGKVWN